MTPKPLPWLLAVFVATSVPAHANVVTTAQASLAAGSGYTLEPGCAQISSVAPVTCSDPFQGATASASGAFTPSGGTFNVAAGIYALPSPVTPNVLAAASAVFSGLLLMTGPVAGNTIVGHYSYAFNGATDPVVGPIVDYSITQAGAPSTFGAPSGFFIGGGFSASAPFTITSAIVPGGAFPEVVMLQAQSFDAFGQDSESSMGSLAFTGFTDLSGAPVAYAIVPEPAMARLFALAILVFLAHRFIQVLAKSN